MLTKNEFLDYCTKNVEELKELIFCLTRIPAPSNDEIRRSEFIKKWLCDLGYKDAYIDEALNVVLPIGDENDLTVFAAHIDTVFPDLEPFEIKIDGDIAAAPGIGDNTTNLAMMLLTIKYIKENGLRPKGGIIFAADSGEEGLGNLKGIRHIMKVYGDRVARVIALDGGVGGMTTAAVGSHRWRVTAKTAGGHSYGSFGNLNAIAVLASMISDFYKLEVPKFEGSRTTYNVGTITGGTSVNTIAQHAEMLFEYRSNDHRCIEIMKDHFLKAMEKTAATGADVTWELIGDRPGGSLVEPARQNALIEEMTPILQQFCDKPIKTDASSTDSNIPLSMGIPSVCVGGGVGKGAHTRAESIDLSRLPQGYATVMAVILNWFE